MQPKIQKIINSLNEQLIAANRLRDRKKMADLQEAIRKVTLWAENPTSTPPDLSRWGFTLESEATSAKPPVLPVELPTSTEVEKKRIESTPVKPEQSVTPVPVDKLENQSISETVTESKPETSTPQAQNLSEEAAPDSAEPEIKSKGNEIEAPVEKKKETSGQSQTAAGQLQSTTVDQLKKFYQNIPEDLSTITNERLANEIRSLTELYKNKENYPEVTEEEWEPFAQTLARLVNEKSARLQKAYKAIAEKIDANELNEALSLTHDALNLAENDNRLQEFLQRCVSGSVSEKELVSWRRALDEFDSVSDHEEKKRILERLRIAFREGRLPEELNTRYLKAQENLEQIRRFSSMITSRMMLGNLAEKKKSYDDLVLQASQTSTVFNGTEYVPLTTQLQQSKDLWEEESSRTMKSIISTAENTLETEPDVSLAYLQERVGRPEEKSETKDNFAPSDITNFNVFYKKVEENARALREARTLIDNLDNALDAFERLTNLLKAKKIFPNYKGIDDLIQQEVPDAARDLASRVDNLLKHAETQALLRKYSARKDGSTNEDTVEYYLTQAKTALNLWPGRVIPAPDLITKKIAEVNAQAEGYQIQEKNYLRLLEKIDVIKDLVNAHNKQKANFELDLLQHNDDFKPFSEEIQKTTALLESLRSTDEKVEKIQEQAQEEAPDWEDICKKCNELLSSIERNTPLFKVVSSIQRRAEIQNNIQLVKKYIQLGKIDDAKDLLSMQGLEATPGQPDPLQVERTIIHEAEADTPAMLTLRQKADKLSLSGAKADLLQSYMLYKYIGGYHVIVEGISDLPPYRLSRVTFEARKKAREVEAKLLKLRDEILAAKKQGLRGSQLKPYFENAQILIRSELLQSGDDQKLVDWVEEEFLDDEEKRLLDANKFDQITEMWTRVKDHSFTLGDRRLKNAQILWAIKNATTLCNTNELEKALELLLKIRDLGTGDPRFDFALSDVYRKMNKYTEAIAAVGSDPRVGTAEKSMQDWAVEYRNRREWLYIQQRIYGFVQGLQESLKKSNEALANYNPSDNTIRLACLENINTVVQTINKTYIKIRKDNAVCADKEFIQIVTNLQNEFLDQIRGLFEKEDKVDPSSALNMLSSYQLLETAFPFVKPDAANNSTLISVKQYVQVHPKIINDVISAVTHRTIAGRINPLLNQFRLWQMCLSGFLSIDGLKVDRQEIGNLQTKLDEDYNRLTLLSSAINELQKDIIWQTATENYIRGVAPVDLETKIKLIKDFGLVDVLEVRQLVVKYEQWLMILNYLATAVRGFTTLINSKNENEIKQEISSRSIIKRIDSLREIGTIEEAIRNLPNIKDRTNFELVLDDQEYEKLYQWFSKKATLTYGPERINVYGWENIKQTVEDILTNLEKWMKWGETVAKTHQSIMNLKQLRLLITKELPFAFDPDFDQRIKSDILLSFPIRSNILNWTDQMAYAKWNSRFPNLVDPKGIPIALSQQMTGFVPIRFRIDIFKDYLRVVTEALDFYHRGPGNDDLLNFPMLTLFSKEIFNLCVDKKKDLDDLAATLEKDIKNAEDDIVRLGNFPTFEELSNLQNAGIGARDQLKLRLQSAEKIGPANKQESDAYLLFSRPIYGGNATGQTGGSQPKPPAPPAGNSIFKNFGKKK